MLVCSLSCLLCLQALPWSNVSYLLACSIPRFRKYCKQVCIGCVLHKLAVQVCYAIYSLFFLGSNSYKLSYMHLWLLMLLFI